jgi:hypothetical protein
MAAGTQQQQQYRVVAALAGRVVPQQLVAAVLLHPAGRRVPLTWQRWRWQ